MPVFDSNCFYIIQCLALVFLAAPCVLFAGGMLICGLLWCGLRITRAMHLRLLGLPRCWPPPTPPGSAPGKPPPTWTRTTNRRSTWIIHMEVRIDAEIFR